LDPNYKVLVLAALSLIIGSIFVRQEGSPTVNIFLNALSASFILQVDTMLASFFQQNNTDHDHDTPDFTATTQRDVSTRPAIGKFGLNSAQQGSMRRHAIDLERGSGKVELSAKLVSLHTAISRAKQRGNSHSQSTRVFLLLLILDAVIVPLIAFNQVSNRFQVKYVTT
jgi:hypothetical protein